MQIRKTGKNQLQNTKETNKNVVLVWKWKHSQPKLKVVVGEHCE